MSEKLKECPFCGEDPDERKVVRVSNFEFRHTLECHNCGLAMFDITEEGLIRTWNSRSISK